MEEKLNRVVKQDKCLEDTLTELLEGRMTQAAFERDLEAEEAGEGEESEAIGMEEVSTTRGTQSSVMEVDEEEEKDEVIVVEEIKWGKMWKQAPSLLPKMLRKRVHVWTATQTPAGSQVQGGSMQRSRVGSGQVGSMGRPCDRCVKHQIQCMVVSGGARCENCWVKHYRCSLVLAEVVGGKDGLLVPQQMKAVAGSQVKGQARKHQENG